MGETEEAKIVRDVYAAAMGEHPWQGVLESTARLLHASGAFMFTTFVPEAQGGLAVSCGLPEPVTRKFLTEVVTVDVWFHELLRRHGDMRTGLTWETDALVPEQRLHRTQMFADYLVPCDIGRSLGSIVGDGTSEALPLAPVSFYRPVRSKPFSADEMATLRRLGPHFTQALGIRHRLQAVSQALAGLAFDCIATPVVVLARDRRILLANPAAEALLDDATLNLVRSGRLHAAEPAQRVALDAALAACAEHRFDTGVPLSVRLGGMPGQGIVVRLCPAPASMPDAGNAPAIAFISKEGANPLDLRGVLKALYGLTQMEAALAHGLADGLTLESYAEQRKVTLATVKSQLRAVFAKTGTRRQSELIKLVYSIAH